MLRLFRYGLIVGLAVFLTAPGSNAGMVRVAKRLNYLDIYGGYSKPVGSINGVVTDPLLVDGRRVSVDIDSAYSATAFFGISYGQLRSGHILYSLGFRYTHHDIKDTINYPPNHFLTWVPLSEKPSYNQYDIDINLNYYLTDPSRAILSPYLGIGFHGGLLAVTSEGYQSTNDVTTALSLNFGADMNLYSGPKDRTLVTLASVNSYNLLASGDRPKYLNVGAAVRFWFRP